MARSSHSRSRSRSRRSSRARAASPLSSESEEEHTVEFTVDEEDAAFLMGKEGRTRDRLQRACGTFINRVDSRRLEIRGPADKVSRTRKYAKLIMAQRKGEIDLERIPDDDDKTVVDVPSECVGLITGNKGAFLKQLQEEWGVVMAFNTDDKGSTTTLGIFGPNEKNRKAVEFKVMSTVEAKCKGFFTNKMEVVNDNRDGLAVEVDKLDMKTIAWALGRQGATRKKIQSASECIVEYVGEYVLYFGTLAQRIRGREYLQMTVRQIDRSKADIDESRDDLTIVQVPSSAVGFVTGNKRATLSKFEDDFGVLMQFSDDRTSRVTNPDGTVKLFIFGPRKSRAGAQLKIMTAVEVKEKGCFTRHFVEGLEGNAEWGRLYKKISDECMSYAVGKEGKTRDKLVRASGCTMEFISEWAILVGDEETRNRGMRYLTWLLEQKDNSRYPLISERSGYKDVTVVKITKYAGEMRMKDFGSHLRDVEQQAGVFCCFAGASGKEAVFVCGSDVYNRKKGEALVLKAADDASREKSASSRSRSRSRSRRPRRSRSRRSSRSKSRRSSRSKSRRRKKRSNSPVRSKGNGIVEVALYQAPGMTGKRSASRHTSRSPRATRRNRSAKRKRSSSS